MEGWTDTAVFRSQPHQAGNLAGLSTRLLPNDHAKQADGLHQH